MSVVDCDAVLEWRKIVELANKSTVCTFNYNMLPSPSQYFMHGEDKFSKSNPTPNTDITISCNQETLCSSISTVGCL